MNEILLEVAKEVKTDKEETVSQISFFESIFKNKKYNFDLREKVRFILKYLYEKRDRYEQSEKLYRNIYQRAQNNTKLPSWR